MALILRKIICTENFEKYATNGGQLLKQAAAMPQEGYKGGVGAYRSIMIMTIRQIINGCVRLFKSISGFSMNGKRNKTKRKINRRNKWTYKILKQ